MHVAGLYLVVSSPGSLRWPERLRTKALHLHARTGLQTSCRQPPAMLFSLLLLMTVHRNTKANLVQLAATHSLGLAEELNLKLEV